MVLFLFYFIRITKIASLSNLHSSKRPRSSLKSINTSDLSHSYRSDDILNRERNTLVVLGCLAEKLGLSNLIFYQNLSFSLLYSTVGPNSACILDTIALEYLIDRIRLGMHSSKDFDEQNISSKYSSTLKIILFALIALEKFAHTSQSKHILLESLTIRTEQTQMNILEYYESWALSENCLRRQIGMSKREIKICI